MSMLATLALADKAENNIPDSVLEGVAPSIVTAEYDVCMSGLSVSTWVEFFPPRDLKSKMRNAQAETTQEEFDPLDILPKDCTRQGRTPVSMAQRHGHSLLFASVIHHMRGSDCDSEASSQADADEDLCCLGLEAKDAQKSDLDDDMQPSTYDALSLCGSQGRTATLESISSCGTQTHDQQVSTKGSLPSLYGCPEGEEEQEEEEEDEEE